MNLSPPTRPTALAAMALATTLLTAAGAAAQACTGIPQGSQGSVAFALGLPEDATTYALEGISSNQDTGLLFTGRFALTQPDVEAFEDRKRVSGSFGWEVESLAEDVSICPTAGLGYLWYAAQNFLSVPFGVAVGHTFDVDRNGEVGFTPYAMPEFTWTRHTVDDVDGSDTDTHFGIVGGLTFSYRALVVGGRVAKVFEDDTDPVFSFYLGAAWR